MRPSPRASRRSDSIGRAAVVAAAAVIVVDQISKALAVALTEGSRRQWGPVTLSVTRNVGGPFGILPGSSAMWVVLTTAILVVAATTIRRSAVSILTASLIGVMIGGGVGNLVDRLLRAPGPGRGGVVDWIVVAPYPKVFNLADVAIRGAGLVLIVALLAQGWAEGRPPAPGIDEGSDRVPLP